MSNTEPYLTPNLGEPVIPVVAPRETKKVFKNMNAILIDSGANINIMNYQHVKDCLSKYLRVRSEDMGQVETASGDVAANNGLRMRISTWDVETDWTALKHEHARIFRVLGSLILLTFRSDLFFRHGFRSSTKIFSAFFSIVFRLEKE